MGQDFSAALADEIASLETELAKDVRYLRLKELKRVALLYGGGLQQGAHITRHPISMMDGAATLRPPVRQPSPSRERALTEALAFVERSGRLVPTREILDHLVATGIEVGGVSPLNNLSAMISTSGKFQSHGRSGWTMARPSVVVAGTSQNAGRGEDGDLNEDGSRQEVLHSVSPA